MRYWLPLFLTSLVFLSSCGNKKNLASKRDSESPVVQAPAEIKVQEAGELEVNEDEKGCYPFQKKENFSLSDEDKTVKILEAHLEGDCIRFVYQYSGCSTKMATMLIDKINFLDSKKQAFVYLKPVVRGAGDCEMLIEDEASFKITTAISHDYEVSWILADSQKPIPIIK